MEHRHVKIGADGAVLPREATKHEAGLDTKTGLMWSVATLKVPNWKPAAQKNAEQWAKDLRAGGFDDWQLPDVEQLFSLADRTKVSPAIDTDVYPETPSDWFWSITPWASSPSGCAWGVHFYDGSADWNGQDDYGFVRAVRVGQ